MLRKMLQGLEIKDLDELKDNFHPRVGVYPYRLIDENFRTYTFEASRNGHGKGILGDRKPDDPSKLQAIVDPTQEKTLRIVFLTLSEEKDFETEKKTPVVDVLCEVDSAFKELNSLIAVSSSRWLPKHEKTLSSEKGVRVGLLVFRTNSTADEAFKSLSMSSDLQVSRGKRMVHSSLEEILKDFNNAYYSYCIDEDVWSQPLNRSSNRSDSKFVMSDVKKAAAEFYKSQATAGSLAVSAEYVVFECEA